MNYMVRLATSSNVIDFVHWDPQYCGVQYSDSLRRVRSLDRIPLWATFSKFVQTDPVAQLVSYTMDIGSLLGGGNRSVIDANHTPPSSAEVKERVKMYLYSASVSSRHVWSLIFPFFLGAAAKFRKAAMSLDTPVSLSVSPHWTYRLPLDGFSLHFIIQCF